MPSRLVDRIRRFVSGVRRIDLQVRDGKRWVKVNAVHVEHPIEPERAGELAVLVKRCADDHVERSFRSGKYRAVIWRRVGAELERRMATFEAESRLSYSPS